MYVRLSGSPVASAACSNPLELTAPPTASSTALPVPVPQKRTQQPIPLSAPPAPPVYQHYEHRAPKVITVRRQSA